MGILYSPTLNRQLDDELLQAFPVEMLNNVTDLFDRAVEIRAKQLLQAHFANRLIKVRKQKPKSEIMSIRAARLSRFFK